MSRSTRVILSESTAISSQGLHWRKHRAAVASAAAVVVSLLGSAHSANADPVNQIATWTGAAGNGSWSNVSNWTPATVPVNNAQNIYNVIVPNGSNITYDEPVPTTINGISYGSGGSLTLGAGEQLTVSNVAALNSNIYASGANTLFSAAGVGVSMGNDVQLSATAGAIVAVGPVSYTFDSSVSETAWGADGTGSMIIAPSLGTITNISQDENNVRPTFSATNGGVIDFSNVRSLVGGYGPGDYNSYSANTFVIGANRMINFANLTTITRYNNFNIQSANYSFPSLQTAGGLSLSLSVGTVVTAPVATTVAGSPSYFSIPNSAVFNAPNLTTLDNSTITIAPGGTMSVPQLQVMQDSLITLQPGETFNYKAPVNFDNSSAQLSGGSTFTIAAASYTCNIGSTVWSADGAGSTVSASSVGTITNISADEQNIRPVFSATNGGIIDLSGVKSLVGGYGSGDYGSYSANSFFVGPNSMINLTSLTSITRYNNFSIQCANYSFPSLQSAGGLALTLAVGTTVSTPVLTSVAGWGSVFNISNFATLSAPSLTTLNNTTINISVGGTMNVPQLQVMQGSAITLQPGETFNYKAPTNFDNSAVYLSGGSSFTIAATSCVFNVSANGAWSADGVGSTVSARSLETITNISFDEENVRPSFSATNGGMVDLSKVRSIVGGYGPGDYGSYSANSFVAQSGGSIRFGNLTVTQYNTFSTDGATATFDFQSLNLGAQSTLTATNLANIVFHGSFTFTTTTAASLNLDQGVVTFATDGRPTLEIAGTDLGTNTNGLNNFGMQQLNIGSSTERTVLELVDQHHNSSGNPALYLLNVSGTGLRIDDGSTLVLNGLDAYSLVNNQFINLNSLFAPGQSLVAYDGGFIAKTMTNIPGGWKTNGSGNWSNATNWNMTAPTNEGDTAYFGPVITAPATITLDQPETAGYVGFEGSQEYTVAGTNTLTINGLGGGNIEVVSGVHQITAPVYLATDTQVAVDNPNDSLRLSNVSTAAYATITKIGAGTLSINPVGGTTELAVSAGTVNMIAAPAAAGTSFDTVTISSGAKWGLVIYNQAINTLAGSGAIDLGFGNLTVTPGSAGSSYSGTITGSAGVENAGLTIAGVVTAGVPASGVLTLSGSATYQGDTNIVSGGLTFGSANIAATLSAYTVASGAVLNLNNNNEQIGSLAGAGNLQLGTGTLTVGGNNQSTTFSGPITGTGGLTLIGTGNLTLAASNSFTGQTTINSGSIILNNSLALQNSTVQINTNNGLNENGLTATVGDISGGGSLNISGPSLTVGGNNATTGYSGVISGVGQLIKTGSGTLYLQNANSYAGGTVINGGVLDINNDSELGAAGTTINLSGGTLFWDSGNSWNDSRPMTVAGLTSGTIQTNGATITMTAPVSGGGTLVKTGNGALVLTTANTVGGINVESGQLELGASGSAGTGTLAVTNIPSGASVVLSKTTGASSTVLTNPVQLNLGASLLTLRVDSGYTLALNGPVSGLADFSTGTGGASGNGVGTGTLVLAGNDSGYNGTITVASGTLSVQSPTALGSSNGATRVSPGATLSFQGPLNYSYAEPIIIAGNLSATGGATVFPGSINLAGPASVNVDGASTLSIAAVFGDFPLTKNGDGTLILTNATSFSGPVTVNAGSIVFQSSQSNSALAIPAAAVVQLKGSNNQNRLILMTPSLTDVGTLDLTSNDLDVQAGGVTSLGQITNLVRQGYDNGTWTGTGITSSTAASDSSHLTALGVMLNSANGTNPLYGSAAPLGLFDGANPAANDVLVKYTYYGDTDLKGYVDGSDYSRIDSAYLANARTAGADTGWFNGDFNYDGVVDGSDYTLIDNAYNQQGVALSAQLASATEQVAGPGGSAAVPEPASVGVLAFCSAGLLGRRRRR